MHTYTHVCMHACTHSQHTHANTNTDTKIIKYARTHMHICTQMHAHT